MLQNTKRSNVWGGIGEKVKKGRGQGRRGQIRAIHSYSILETQSTSLRSAEESEK